MEKCKLVRATVAKPHCSQVLVFQQVPDGWQLAGCYVGTTQLNMKPADEPEFLVRDGAVICTSRPDEKVALSNVGLAQFCAKCRAISPVKRVFCVCGRERLHKSPAKGNIVRKGAHRRPGSGEGREDEVTGGTSSAFAEERLAEYPRMTKEEQAHLNRANRADHIYRIERNHKKGVV